MDAFAAHLRHEQGHRSPPDIEGDLAEHLRSAHFFQAIQVLVGIPKISHEVHHSHRLKQPERHTGLRRAHTAADEGPKPLFLGENIGDHTGLAIFQGPKNDAAGV